MKNFKVLVNGTEYEVGVEEIGGVPSAPVSRPAAAAAPAPAAPVAPKPAAAAAPAAGGGSGTITAPLPGTVFKLNVSAGDSVAAGDVVMVLEAMKMENDISSPVAGTVKEVKVSQGDSVESGQVLIVIG